MAGSRISTDLQKKSLEDMLFKFSNQIGALLCYIIIEALRPTETPKLIQDRKKIAIEFVGDAISPQNLLQTFLATLPYEFRKKYGIGPFKIETDEQGKIVVDALGKYRKSMIQNDSIAPEINQLYINKN